MNFEIVFSTYINATGTSTDDRQLQYDLVELANANDVQGFSLRDQVGYWAGELEQSHVLELLDTTRDKAVKLATELKAKYHQDAVILRPITTEVQFI